MPTPSQQSHVGDPNARIIGTFTGELSKQDPEIQNAVTSLRNGKKPHEAGSAAMPPRLDLVMTDETKIKSWLQRESMTVSQNGDIRLSLAKWDSDKLTWCVVDIVGNDITVQVHQNPPERTGCEWRKQDPTIIYPVMEMNGE